MIQLPLLVTTYGAFLILCGFYGFLAFHAPTAFIASGFGVLVLASRWGLNYSFMPWVVLLLNAALIFVFTKRVLGFLGQPEKFHQLVYFSVADVISIAVLVLLLAHLFKK